MLFLKRPSLSISLLILLFICFSPKQSLAQQNNIDSLEATLSSSVHDTIQVSIMLKLINHYLKQNHQKARKLSLQLIPLTKQLKDKKSEAKAYNFIAIIHHRMNSPTDSMMAYFDKSYQLAKAINDKALEAKSLCNKAIIYHENGLDDKALDLYNIALKLCEEIGDENQRSLVLNNMATVFHVRGDSEMALAFYKKALKTVEKLGLDSQVSRLSLNIGKVYSDNNRADTALVYYGKALKENQDEYFKIIILGEMGVAHMIKKEYERASEFISNAHQLAKDLDDPNNYGYTIYLLTDFANQTGDDMNTIKYSLEGLKILESGTQIRPKIDYYAYLKDAYTRLGNYQEALEANENYHILNDSLHNIDREKHINDLLIKHETEQKELENQLLSTTISEQKNQQYLLIALLFASFGFLIAFFSIIKIRQIKKIERMRMDIAQDLHDEVGSKLTLIQIYVNKLLGAIGPQKSKERIDIGKEINKVIKDTHFSISDLVWSINPQSNTMKDLIDRLNDYADDFLKPAEIPYQFDKSSFALDKKLDPSFRQNIMLIFKEALNNILKHTNPTIVKIKLFDTNNSFNLEIINEFESTKTNSLSNGNGLQNMENRAQRIKGHIHIEEKSDQFRIVFSTKASSSLSTIKNP